MSPKTRTTQPKQFQSFYDKAYMHLLQNVSFQPIFIMGDHRSGTTLLYKTLTGTKCFNFVSAYHIIKYDEILANYVNKTENEARQELEEIFKTLNINDRLFDKVVATPDSPEEYAFILLNAGYKTYLTPENALFFTELCSKIQYVQDLDKPLLVKNPWDFAHYMYVKSVFPTAKFIFIHRHPIHIINSKLKGLRLMLSSRGAYCTLISKRYRKIFDQPVRRLIYRLLYSPYFNLGLSQVTKTTIQSTSYYLENISSLSNTDYISTTYEELCKAPEETIFKILEFLRLKPIQHLDYESLINPRPLKLLPEVEKNYDKICQNLKLYLTYNNYDV